MVNANVGFVDSTQIKEPELIEELKEKQEELKETNRLSDDQLIEKFKNCHCEESFQELVKRHSPLCYTISQKFYPADESVLSAREISDNKYYIFYKSILAYNKDRKTKFSTWLANYVRYYCLDILSDENSVVAVDPDKLTEMSDTQADTENLIYFEYIMSVLDKLQDKRIKQIFESRFLSGPKNKPWKEVAKDIGISNQQCINLFIRAKKFLRAKIDKSVLLEEF